MDLQKLYKIESDHWWFQSRRNIITHLFWKKQNFTNPKILSIGISSGAELDFLAKYGNVTGVEICPNASDHSTKLGHKVINKDILKCDLDKNEYDIIFAMDVLEHIKEDEKALGKIVNALKPNGHLIITVPACMFLWSKFDELGDYPHVRRYSKKGLIQLLKTQNLNIKKISYYNFFLFPLMFITRKLMKFKKPSLELPNKFLNRFLGSIFSSEKYFTSKINFPIGSSLIAICTK